MNDSVSVNQNMLLTALSGELPETRLSSYRKHQGGIARLQLDALSQITEVSSELTLDETDYLSIVEGIMMMSENSGIIHYENNHMYLYLRVILKPTDEPVIVIQEVISTLQSLLNFLKRIGLVLLLALILIFFASLSITQHALAPIKKAWKKQVDFTSDASHELRTPLFIIQTNLECATDNPTETIQENEQWFNNIKIETSRMTKLVNDLLTLSRTDSNEQAIKKVDFNLGEVFGNTIAMIKPYAEKTNITLYASIQPDMIMNGDEELIKRLAVILLDNAIKYTPSYGKIFICADQNVRNIVIKISDTGIGIGKEHIDKIFDRFYQVDGIRSSNLQGSGLGLSLAKWIVTEHNGSIVVESEVGNGSKFVITLPVVR